MFQAFIDAHVASWSTERLLTVAVLVIAGFAAMQPLLVGAFSGLSKLVTDSGVMMQLVFGTSLVGISSSFSKSIAALVTSCVGKRCMTTASVSTYYSVNAERYLRRYCQLPAAAKVVAHVDGQAAPSCFSAPFWVCIFGRWMYVCMANNELSFSMFGLTCTTKPMLQTIVDSIIAEDVLEKDSSGAYIGACVLRFDAKSRRWLSPEPLKAPSLSATCMDRNVRRQFLEHVQQFFAAQTTASAKCTGSLLLGPVGTGKTTIAFALAKTLDVPAVVLNLQDPDLTDDILRVALGQLKRPCVVVIDEAHTLDCLCQRGSEEISPNITRAAPDPRKFSSVTNGITCGGMLALMDGASAFNSGPKYYVLITSENLLSQAILRRVPLIVYTKNILTYDNLKDYIHATLSDDDEQCHEAATLFTASIFKKNLVSEIMQYLKRSRNLSQALEPDEIRRALRVDVRRRDMNGCFIEAWKSGYEHIRGLDIWSAEGQARGRSPMIPLTGASVADVEGLQSLVHAYSSKYGDDGNKRLAVYMRNQLHAKDAIDNFSVVMTCDRSQQQYVGKNALAWIIHFQKSHSEDRIRWSSGHQGPVTNKMASLVSCHERCTVVSAVLDEFPSASLEDVFREAEGITTAMGWCPLCGKILSDLLDEASSWQHFFQLARDFLFGSLQNSFDYHYETRTRSPSMVAGLSRDCYSGGRCVMNPEFFKRPKGRYLIWAVNGEGDEEEFSQLLAAAAASTTTTVS
jgi:hypothetical protein